ncbi:energy-coupling factor ABC transporter ATP-binding protein [Paenibacillus solisilvae]|uniref:Energy-coupling factor ABC transporter ATP-binding protein n=1 Tax=Paenibacillus solisilvae TaxID=2486751 RepID=A0ABW0VU53_9BACL
MSNLPLISFRNVSFGYEKNLPTIIRDINLDIFEGDFVALIGQNGAGKTTMAKHINGILKPTKGEVTVRGKLTSDYKRDELAKVVGYCYQNPDHQIFSQTVEKEIAYGPKAIGLSPAEVQERVKDALHLVDLEEKRQLHPSLLGRGERQRLAVASILAMGASILVIDEPTTGLDYAGITRIMNLLRTWNEKMKVTIIIITHDIPMVADYVPRTIIMAQGQILKNAPTPEVLTDFALLKMAAVKPLQVTRVSERLGILNADNRIITVRNLFQVLSNLKNEESAEVK